MSAENKAFAARKDKKSNPVIPTEIISEEKKVADKQPLFSFLVDVAPWKVGQKWDGYILYCFFLATNGTHTKI